MRCPTLQRLLECERDSWFGLIKAIKPIPPANAKAWDDYSEALSKLLGREDLYDYLLEDKE